MVCFTLWVVEAKGLVFLFKVSTIDMFSFKVHTRGVYFTIGFFTVFFNIMHYGEWALRVTPFILFTCSYYNG